MTSNSCVGAGASPAGLLRLAILIPIRIHATQIIQFTPEDVIVAFFLRISWKKTTPRRTESKIIVVPGWTLRDVRSSGGSTSHRRFSCRLRQLSSFNMTRNSPNVAELRFLGIRVLVALWIIYFLFYAKIYHGPAGYYLNWIKVTSRSLCHMGDRLLRGTFTGVLCHPTEYSFWHPILYLSPWFCLQHEVGGRTGFGEWELVRPCCVYTWLKMNKSLLDDWIKRS